MKYNNNITFKDVKATFFVMFFHCAIQIWFKNWFRFDSLENRFFGWKDSIFDSILRYSTQIRFKNRISLFQVVPSSARKKNSSLNFTELFKNCRLRYFGNKVKENIQNFSW